MIPGCRTRILHNMQKKKKMEEKKRKKMANFMVCELHFKIGRECSGHKMVGESAVGVGTE